eukprot:TRINITY_DN10192_c0_g1_i1.p1 TRINITY_DN10192_c0_g1~~TRINITY_DN10192_c0_g1_i1.p1  ORF type:complete len:191 (-),score=59.64 TRINITY_DN10192_c0_g1_i1:113-685(-)
MKTVQTNMRKQKDILSLMSSKYAVIKEEGKSDELAVIFPGPENSFYEGGAWKVGVYLPEQYPFKSPSIGFLTRILHPNIDEKSGSICLDVLNQTWTPLFELQHIFDVFLPQLLLYPNPKDPLNGDAARLMLSRPDEYKSKVKEHVAKYGMDPDLLAIIAKHSKTDIEKVIDNKNDDGELSETSLKSDEEA